jgi:type VI secretion system secreted protein VgrG
MPKLSQNQDLAFTFFADGLEADDMRPISFSGSENIFGLHHFDIELVSHKPNIDLHELLDNKCTLTIHHKYQGVRHISGVIAEVERGDEGAHRTFYSVVLMPILHRLNYGSDCKIFQQKTVPEIIKAILKEHGIQDVKWTLAGDHQPREYCVQYRETHLEFISRIAAEEGIFFYHTHDANGKHTLCFLDDSQLSPKLEISEKLTYNPEAGGNVKGPYVSSFRFRERLRSTSWTQRDYTFKNPPYNLQHNHRAQEDNGSAKDYAMYDYPGRYKKDAAGKPFTKHLMESTRTSASNAEGQCDNIDLCVGFKTKLEEHQDKRLNINYLLLAVDHRGEQPSALEEEGGEGGTFYNASFQAMPTRLPYKPPQKDRPLVDGPQMAHIVGPPGEEIYCDEHGRVKVQFPWDRYAKGDEHCSCWIRVASNWAGTMWGHIAIPRIGQEVIVDFLEGDPDQPIITGRTYHARNKSPYTLPDHKTKMVIRSDSHKADGYNEISFEDEGGQENIFFHAQKDMTFKVLNNRAKRVENNQVESVGSNKNIEIGGNHAEKIGGSMNVTVGGGSGGALMGALGAVLAAGGGDGAKGAGATGNPAIGTFMSGIAAAGALAESASSSGNSGFNAAGEHFPEAGKAQQSAASTIGGILSKIMPMSGILNTVIEKFSSTTIGIAETKQIGAMKNTSVGHTMTTQVGSEQHTTVKKIATHYAGKLFRISSDDTFEGAAQKNWKINAGDTLKISAPGGYIEINKSGIKIRGLKVDIEGNAINFTSGGKGEGSQCLREMAKSSTPFVR